MTPAAAAGQTKPAPTAAVPAALRPLQGTWILTTPDGPLDAGYQQQVERDKGVVEPNRDQPTLARDRDVFGMYNVVVPTIRHEHAKRLERL